MEKILELLEKSTIPEKNQIATYIMEQELMLRQYKTTNNKLLQDMDELIIKITEYEKAFLEIEGQIEK